MDWKQRIEQSLNEGYTVSRKLFGKAKQRAVELGEHGVLSLEVRQLEAKYSELLSNLGSKVRQLLVDEKRSTVTAKSQGVKEILEQIEETEQELARKRHLMQEHAPDDTQPHEVNTGKGETGAAGERKSGADEKKAERPQAEPQPKTEPKPQAESEASGGDEHSGTETSSQSEGETQHGGSGPAGSAGV
jgi:hypothetical protein